MQCFTLKIYRPKLNKYLRRTPSFLASQHSFNSLLYSLIFTCILFPGWKDAFLSGLPSERMPDHPLVVATSYLHLLSWVGLCESDYSPGPLTKPEEPSRKKSFRHSHIDMSAFYRKCIPRTPFALHKRIFIHQLLRLFDICANLPKILQSGTQLHFTRRQLFGLLEKSFTWSTTLYTQGQ